MSTQTYTETLTVLTCCRAECSVTFAFTEGYERRRREDHEWFYCPNGHRQHYSEPGELERVKRQLKYTRESEEFHRGQAALARRQAAAFKGQRTRVLNLITKGICPVAGCRRNFENVRQHMADQHPDFHEHEDRK
jgi:hypothetical protein